MMHLMTGHVLSMIHPMTDHSLLLFKIVTSLKNYEIQGIRVCLSMEISIGLPCVSNVENRAIILAWIQFYVLKHLHRF